MPRTLTYQQGCKEVEWVLNKYPRDLKDRKVRAIIDNILWGVAEGDGPELANAIITRYELWCGWNGPHHWFDDGEDHIEVIDLDPNFEIPDEWRIFPGDKKHPGKVISPKELMKIVKGRK